MNADEYKEIKQLENELNRLAKIVGSEFKATTAKLKIVNSWNAPLPKPIENTKI